jgi:hypothetical protein
MALRLLSAIQQTLAKGGCGSGVRAGSSPFSAKHTTGSQSLIVRGRLAKPTLLTGRRGN